MTLPARSFDTYSSFLKEIRQQIHQGQRAIERFIDRQKVETNWQVGAQISRYIETQQGNKNFSHIDFYTRLAEDLHVTKRFLQKTVQFYQTYPVLDLDLPFNWTHYVLLISMPDTRTRRRWEKKIVQEKLSATKMKNAWRVTQQALKVDDTVVDLNDVQRGQLYTYRLIQETSLHEGDRCLLDLGFDMSYDCPTLMKPSYHSGKLVQSFLVNEQYALKQVAGVRDDLYTYKAHVMRVVDGDTLLVHVDVGFGLWREERLRLRGINAPELKTTAGDRVKKYVEQELRVVPFVVIKTYGSDKYDRYLVDVFYLAGENDVAVVAAQGRLLNYDLLDAGLATVWSK